MPRGIRSVWLASLALLLTVSCDETANRGDGGTDDDAWTGTCAYDQNVDFDTAETLKAGETKTDGYICPEQDQDFYKIEVPAGAKLLRIQLNYVTTAPKLDLTYRIFASDKKTPVDTAGDGIYNKFDALHCLSPGTYYLLVEDEGSDDFDNMNSYSLTYSTETDKDTNEPNDTPSEAKTITGSATGYISCQKDVDYFKVNVGADQLLKIGLTSSKTTSVDLQYTIYDDTDTMVFTDAIKDGTKPDAKIDDLRAVPKAGTYTIAVQDMDDNESDGTAAYTLTVGTVAEQDPQDKGTRNDTPDKATVVGTAGASLLAKTYTGQFGSKGDVDYFVINGLSGVSEDNPAVMEVILSTPAGQQALDPSFSMIYTDASSSCTKDSCCKVLASASCTDNTDCLRQTYSCINKGDNFCNDTVCSPNPSPICPTEKSCAGATLCMSNKKCGAEHAFRVAKNKTTASTVQTSQLLVHPGPWYVRVSDQGDDEYEHGRNYQLSIKVRMDPDGAKELDTELFANRCMLIEDGWTSDQEWQAHVVQAKTKIASKQISLGSWVSGYLSYEGDIDFYEIANPCPNADCTLAIDYKSTGCPSSGAPLRYCQDPKEVSKYMGLEFLITIRRTNKEADGWTSFIVQPGTSGTWGAPSTCVYSYSKHGSSPYYVTVEDMGQNYWSWNCKYEFQIRKVADGCVAPCKIGGDGTCTN